MHFFRDRFVFPNFVSKKCFSTEFVFLTKIVILHNRGSSMAPKTKKLGIKSQPGGCRRWGGDTPEIQKPQKSQSRVGKKQKKTTTKKTIPPHTSYGLHWLGIHSDLTPTHLRRLRAQFPPPQWNHQPRVSQNSAKNNIKSNLLLVNYHHFRFQKYKIFNFKADVTCIDHCLLHGRLPFGIEKLAVQNHESLPPASLRLWFTAPHQKSLPQKKRMGSGIIL